MMDTADLLAQLREKGVRLWLDDDNVRCSAPAGVLDAATRAALSERKDAIRNLLALALVAKSHPALVPINPGRAGMPPIFVVSGHGGDVFYLLQMARHLDPAQPVFGVRPPGLDGGEPLTTVEAIAGYEIEQIRRYRPSGPYLIAGHCAGGTIAFEVACQLLAAGQHVAFLGLLGAPFPSRFQHLPQAINRVWRLKQAMLSESPGELGRYISTKLRDRLPWLDASAGADLARTPARQRVERATVAAVRQYRPARYSGQIDLFITGDQWHRTHLWREHAASAREHVIPDHKIDDLLLGPEVWRLADLVQQRLRTVLAPL